MSCLEYYNTLNWCFSLPLSLSSFHAFLFKISFLKCLSNPAPNQWLPTVLKIKVPIT